MENPLLTFNEVLERVRVTPPTLRSWIRLGLFPRPLRIGRTLRFLEDDLVAWLEREKEHRQAAARCDAARQQRDEMQKSGSIGIITMHIWAASEVAVSRTSEIETSEEK